MYAFGRAGSKARPSTRRVGFVRTILFFLDIGGHVSDWGLLISRSARYSSTFLNLAMCGSGSFEKVSMQPGQHRLTMMPLWLTRANPPPRSTFLPQTMQLGVSFWYPMASSRLIRFPFSLRGLVKRVPRQTPQPAGF